MSQPAAEITELDPGAQLEIEVQEAIDLCGGDARAALRATLMANSYLQGEVDRLEAAASPGFARRRRQRVPNMPEGIEKKVG
jgi:hypothetical protein